MKKFFNPDNFLWRGFARLADFMFLSCCFFVCGALVVTIPAAAIALYDAVAHCLHGDESKPFARFFRTFKNELMRSIGLTVVWGLIAGLLGAVYQILFQLASSGSIANIAAIFFYFSLFIPLAIFCWVIPVESRFVYGFGQLHKVAFIFAFRHLPSSLIIVALGLVTFEVCVNMPFMLMLLPGFCAYFQSFFIEKVFAKYMPKQEEAATEE